MLLFQSLDVTCFLDSGRWRGARRLGSCFFGEGTVAGRADTLLAQTRSSLTDMNGRYVCLDNVRQDTVSLCKNKRSVTVGHDTCY